MDESDGGECCSRTTRCLHPGRCRASSTVPPSLPPSLALLCGSLYEWDVVAVGWRIDVRGATSATVSLCSSMSVCLLVACQDSFGSVYQLLTLSSFCCSSLCCVLVSCAGQAVSR